jgi:hypothetical protein
MDDSALAGIFKGWGYIAAVFDDSGKLERFQRTDAKKLGDR